MLSAPIFVYSEKSAKEYLTTLQINKDTKTLNLLTLKGVEYSTEEDYFKVQNFFLEESFDDGVGVDTQFDSAASLLLTTTNVFVALWGNSQSVVSANLTTTTVQGVSGYLSCAHYEETESAKTATLTFDAVSALRSINTSIGASDVTLGSTTTGILTTTRGNYLTGQNSYQNNPTFYPFSLNPGGVSRSYGSNTNSVPSNGYVKEIRLISNASQQSQTYNNTGYTLNLKFDLWSGNQFIASKNIVLLSSGQNLQAIDALVHTIASEQDYLASSGIRFLNVNLVNVPVSTGTETAATTYYGLLLDTSANYYTTDNVNLVTKPFIESPVFLLKDGSNVEFSGFDSVTVTGVANPNNGIEVEAKLSNTEVGLLSANYVKLGTITTAGTSTTFLRLDDPAYESARNAKYVQIKFSGVINSNTGTYLQSSFNKAITLNQINLNRKQVLANDFVGQFKFSDGYQSTTPVTLFGPFDIFTDKTDEMTALGTYTYNATAYTYKNFIALNSFREGRLHYNFENYDKIYYIAKGNENNINTNGVPTYTPSAAALAKFAAAPNAPTGYTKRLVFKYDIDVAQLTDSHWDGCKWNVNALTSRYGFHWIGKTTNYSPPTVVSGTQKTVTVTIDGGGSYSLSDSDKAKRYLAAFDIKKTNVANFRKFFGFKFRNFREVVVYQNNSNSSDIKEAANTFWVSYGNNDPFKAYTTGQAVATNGLWYATSNQNYINTLESTNEFFATSPQPITRVAIPSFTFDTFEGLATDGTPRDFEARILIKYYNSSDQVIDNTQVVKAFTGSSLSETIIETPTAASASKKVGFKLLLIPKNVTFAEDLGLLGSNFSINNVAITKGKYLIPTISYFHDVGLNFSSKPRLEYIDNASNPATKYKRYVKSIAVSKFYDLLDIADVAEEVGNPPLLRTEVIYGGSVSKPDGTDIVVEWCGKNSTGDSCGSLDWKLTTSDSTVKNKKYIKYRVTLTPTSDGRKAPVIDSLSVRFWPYNAPYVAYEVENLAEEVSNVILSKFETKDVERDLAQLELDVSIDDVTPIYVISSLDQEQNIMQDIGESDRGVDVTVKTIFLHEDARLRDAKVDLFYITAP